MEPPTSFETEAIRNEISKVFRSLRPLSPDDIAHNILRAQYSEGKLNGTKLPGYREEPNVNKQSTTETFVALKLYIDNWRWAHVPFYIYTGKRLSEKRSEISVPRHRHYFRDNVAETLAINSSLLYNPTKAFGYVSV